MSNKINNFQNSKHKVLKNKISIFCKFKIIMLSLKNVNKTNESTQMYNSKIKKNNSNYQI